MKNSEVKIGALLGVLSGLLYGATAGMINSLFLPGVPLFQDALGLPGTILLMALAGAVMGVLVSWPEDAIVGVIAGALFAALGSSILGAIEADWRFPALMMLFAWTFLPRAVLLLPAAALLRWAVSFWQQPENFWAQALRRRAIVVLVLGGLVLLGGSFSLYPREERFALQRVNAVVRAGLNATQLDALPGPLRYVPAFYEQAGGAYTLQRGLNPDALPAQRPPVNFGEIETLVIIRFESGYRMGCVDAEPYPEPVCWIY